ncbi:carbon-nitrogen hydrolase family protein [Saccharopolyspora sp. WRP15-2]|uniref:Carbon-nitrogen hydrolase family protein n=1 Tax=Saccharopolyspora oryzae TaxID=2997343 RepID=A0ABT4UVL3_9PSEU|nr:carbon-nitrogen hydrolase family protein [Saccharopolyspora oryzae]MDA3625740.1 carbon-nitrogen hydrolase family protein [Saccharopolyspora oryzae]
MRAKFTAAAVQEEIGYLDPTGNAERFAKRVQEEAAAGAELIVLPELANIGYPVSAESDDLADYYHAAEHFGGEFTQAIRDAAVSTGTHVVVGFAERHATLTGVIANTAALIRPDASTEFHRKIHLPRLEKSYFEPGGELTPFDTELGRIGVLVCADNSFPEAARVLALRGAEVIAVSYQAPTLPNPTLYHGLTATRAYENQCYAVAANRCGAQGELPFCGTSAIGAPDGTLPAALDDQPGTARAELDADLLVRTRLFQTRYRDRRPDLYEPIAQA